MKRLFFAIWAVSCLTACAPELYRTVVEFRPLSEQTPKNVFRVREPVNIKLDSGYTREIKAGSTWRFVGTVPQGRVFRPVDDVFTVEGANVHEAYLVLDSGRLVGFYLPVEGAFSPLKRRGRVRFE
ncbi:MAG TPA: hypothetical protein VK143_11445 [Burkholderiales bacterium]|nr:hypothetical protein [Burkholderiales bacterium]